jgi:hypothetical protein
MLDRVERLLKLLQQLDGRDETRRQLQAEA